ncbi:MAG TPA: hypothetical protein VLL25_16815 [Acidimicrobiales bacterium]|nr:hypothetical protein [Acidimicrobiales bacterium]
MTKQWAGLTYVEVVSGTAQDGPTAFRGFVTVRALGEDGSVMAGQLRPGEVRAMALQFLEAAEAAEQDAIVFTILTRDQGADPDEVAGLVQAMRAERDR